MTDEEMAEHLQEMGRDNVIVKGIARDEWDFNVAENRNDEDIIRQMINQVVTDSYLEINLKII